MQKWFYLDDPVYMLTRHYVERHSKKDLEVLSLYNVMCPLHGHTLVIPDGRTHFPLLLLLSRNSLPFGGRGGDFLDGGSRRSHPHALDPRDDGSGICK